MIPSPLPSDIKSSAPQKMFVIFARGLPDTWTVLHSLGIGNHSTKPWTAIDFVLVGPPGVFCIEVKGGRVRREGGRWCFTGRHDKDPGKQPDPFRHGGGAAAAHYSNLAH